ncbi:hypothetical protein ABW19_dt0207089 [Dactylella cylindrospora]|nr:hypothetical protein ABW19_dt0207089 [Dactylella cylindrospora]
MEEDDYDVDDYGGRKQYGRTRRYKKVEDGYPEDDHPTTFSTQYQHGDIQSAPDLQSIMANARAAEFSRTLHKLRREDLEQRDPAMLILNKMEKPTRFSESSLRPVVKNALAKAYPNVTAMSYTQRNLLLLLQEGYSVCATGPPGSGKTFTTILWLLQLMRSTKPTLQPNGRLQKTPTTTALVFVPSVDLLHQYMETLNTLYEAFHEPGKPAPPKETIFQGFIRFNKGQSEVEEEQMQVLRKYPSPHIIVATPTRFLDILNNPEAKDLIDLDNLKVIVADEVDAMINQRPTPKKIDDLRNKKKQRKEMRWHRPAPLETCIDFIVGKREMMAEEAGRSSDQLQFCFISPNLSPVLKSKVTMVKNWVECSESDSNSNHLINLGMQDFSALFNHDRINPIVSLPPRIKHHALSVDMMTGIMRDIPSYNEDVLIRSKDEKLEIEKYVNILRTHHDPRVEYMSREALMVEAAQEGILNDEEGGFRPTPYFYPGSSAHPDVVVKDITTDLRNDFRHVSIPRQLAVEILEYLLKRENYPENVLVYVTAHASRGKYIAEFEAAGYQSEQIRYDTAKKAGIRFGRSDIPSAPNLEKTPRTKADCKIWVGSSVNLRGIDLPQFTHAYVIVPTTGYQKYCQMAGRIARYPFPKQVGRLPEPQGKITTIFLEEEVGEHRHAPMVDGVIQVGSPVEALAWRRIHRMYGLCGAKVDKYFGPDEVNVVLRSADQFGKFPDMDVELPWEGATPMVNGDHAIPEANSGSLASRAEPESSFEFLPLEEPSAVPATSSETAEGYQETTTTLARDIENSDSIEPPSNLESSLADQGVGAPQISTQQTEIVLGESSPIEERVESEAREDESGQEDLPSIYEKSVELEDGPHFALEESGEVASEATTASAEGESLDTPLEIGEGITEEEAQEFQQAQDDIFAAFLELNVLQEQIRKSTEGKNDPSQLDPDELEEREFEAEVGEVADMDIDGVKIESKPAPGKPEGGKSDP